MASKLSVHAGLIAEGRGILEAAILSILVDRFLKAEKAAISLGDIEEMTGQSEGAIFKALENLMQEEVITFDQETNSISEIKPTALHLVTSHTKQKRFDYTEATEAVMVNDRNESGVDVKNGYYGRVGKAPEETTWNLVITNDDGKGEYEPFAEDLVNITDFQEAFLAWQWFDSYVSGPSAGQVVTSQADLPQLDEPAKALPAPEKVSPPKRSRKKKEGD
jgi:hypothetical protein